MEGLDEMPNGQQKAVPGVVYFVGTPIGNLEDITMRAISIIRSADIVAAEDTRHTGRLFKLLGIERTGKLVSHHQHNSHQRVPELIEAARNGKSIAVVSDAGTPGISDPGIELAAACHESNIQTVPIPGPCAAISALSVSGFDTSAFVYVGFLPSKRGAARSQRIAEVSAECRVVVLYEAPYRLLRTLLDLNEESKGKDRNVVCAKELTKVHEEIYRGTLAGAIEKYKAEKDSNKLKGEYTLVLGPKVDDDKTDEKEGRDIEEKLTEFIEGGMRPSSAAKFLARETNQPKKSIYEKALKISLDLKNRQNNE